MRRSLLIRLLVLSLTVAAGAIVATAALATHSTRVQLQEGVERSASLLETDRDIYESLMAYGLDHDAWDGVDVLVAELSERTDRRIALVDAAGNLIVDSARSGGEPVPPLPGAAVATVDAAGPGALLEGATPPDTSRTTFPDVPLSDRPRPIGPIDDPEFIDDPSGVVLYDHATSGLIGILASGAEYHLRTEDGEPVPRFDDRRYDETVMVDFLAPVSPYWRSTERERTDREQAAEQVAACLLDTDPPLGLRIDTDGAAEFELDGRPLREIGAEELQLVEEMLYESTAAMPQECKDVPLNAPSRAAAELNRRGVEEMVACVQDAGLDHQVLRGPHGLRQVVATEPFDDGSGQDGAWRPLAEPSSPAWAACAGGVQEAVLRSYVAPPVQLYLGVGPQAFDALEGVGLQRTAWMAFAVLLVAAAITLLVGHRMVRPIRALTAAAGRMASGDRSARVAAQGGDEIARLGRAFNTMAESVDEQERRRRAMVGDVAHELRTPLASVKSQLEAAEDGVVSLDGGLLRSLGEDTAVLERLVGDLQDLALADAGMLRLHPEELDVTGIAEQVVVGNRDRARAAGLRVELDAPEPAVAMVDSVRLRQALGNLVVNALTYAGSGSSAGAGSVVVSVRAEPDAVVCSVTDTGPGIAAEHLPHLFERFYRVDRSRSRTTGGSGLGLAITEHLITAHGGTVGVESTVGVGSCFTIRIPTGSLPPDGA